MKMAVRMALVAVAAAVGGCSGSKTPYTSAAGNFRVDMPATPKETEEDVPTLVGVIKGHSATATDSSNTLFNVSYADLPPNLMRFSSPDAVLDGAANGAIQKSGVKSLGIEKSTYYGYPGREVTFEARSSKGVKEIGRLRIVLAANRLYQILMVGAEANATAKIATAFFDSFSPLDKAPPGAGSPAPASAPAPVAEHQMVPSQPGPGRAAAADELPGWGSLVDPLNDAKIFAKDNSLTITVPGTLHDFNPPPGKFDAPRQLQDVDGDFTADVQVPEVPRPEGQPTGANLPFNGAGIVAWVDGNNFLRFEHAGILRGTDTITYALCEGRDSGRGIGQDGPMPPGASWLRLQRRGTRLSTFASQDGMAWTPLASANVSWPAAAKVGVMAVNATDKPYSARFRDLKITRP